jgi:Zn finger protein HypA/HybF involved in hydrogenase expression
MGVKSELIQPSYYSSRDDKEGFVKCKNCGFTQPLNLVKENFGCCMACGAEILRIVKNKKGGEG